METVDLGDTDGRSYPAGRVTKNLVGGTAPLEAEHFCMGVATLDPEGGQVPWHNHPQEEVYVLLEGRGEMCVGDERQEMAAGEAVYIPAGTYHQLTNVGDTPLHLLYCDAPAGDVDHWKHELNGTLAKAGDDAPPLPDGARREAL
ncbi:MAG: dimethylsulfonioproprionate lyase family protein, partial [Salinivenus sp.]